MTPMESAGGNEVEEGGLDASHLVRNYCFHREEDDCEDVGLVVSPSGRAARQFFRSRLPCCGSE